MCATNLLRELTIPHLYSTLSRAENFRLYCLDAHNTVEYKVVKYNKIILSIFKMLQNAMFLLKKTNIVEINHDKKEES